MSHLTLVEPTRKATYKPNYLQKMIDSYGDFIDTGSAADLRKAVYNGVHVFDSVDENQLDADNILLLYNIVTALVSKMTPHDLMLTFPVAKTFDGGKYGSKDYFFTMQALSAHGLNTPLGNKTDELLADYENPLIRKMCVLVMMAVVRKNKELTGRDMLREFTDSLGVKTYTSYTDQNGQQFMMDEDGRTCKLEKSRLRWLKLVK